MKYIFAIISALFTNSLYASICTPDPEKHISVSRCYRENFFYLGKGRASYINNKNIQIKTNYDIVLFDKEGFRIVKKDGKYGFLRDSDNKLITPIKFDYAKDFSEGLAVVKVGDKYGVINTEGELVIAPAYEHMESFKEGLFIVEENNRFGAIDHNNKLVIPIIYRELHSFSNGLARAKVNKKYGFINQKNEIVLPFNYFRADDFSENISNVTLKVPCDDKRITKADKPYFYYKDLKHFIDKKGQLVIDVPLFSTSAFKNGFVRLLMSNKKHVSNKQFETNKPCFDHRYLRHFIDKKGQFIGNVPFIYASAFKNGFARVLIGNKNGVVNNKGELVIEAIYSFISNFNYGMATVVKNGKYGMINTKGEVVIPLEYELLIGIKENVIEAKQSGFHFQLDRQGIPLKYDQLCFDISKTAEGRPWVKRAYRCN